MKFTKMHGIGNDYIYINCFEENIENPSELAKKISPRHFAIGGDGIVLIMPSTSADVRMRMFNLDGSEAQMCGNAIRCVGKYVYDNKIIDKLCIRVETLAGLKILNLNLKDGLVDTVRVNMGQPILESKRIPVIHSAKQVVNQPIMVDGCEYKITCVSMGNPHAVVYLDNLNDLEITKTGPMFENNLLFPERINTEFVKVIDRTTLKMRVWERGSGETLACGTGACAVLVASVLNDLSERKATIELIGGNLEVEWNEDGFVYMTGPAEKVYDGVIEI